MEVVTRYMDLVWITMIVGAVLHLFVKHSKTSEMGRLMFMMSVLVKLMYFAPK